MDSTLHNPPTRIVPHSSLNITVDEAQQRVAAFLEEHADRTRMLGGDTAVTGQLAKLQESLAQEQLERMRKPSAS